MNIKLGNPLVLLLVVIALILLLVDHQSDASVVALCAIAVGVSTRS